MEVYVAIVSGLIAALVLWWIKSSGSTRRDSRLRSLPGPWGFPIVGSIPYLSAKPYLDFTKLAKRYGNVYNIRLGSKNIVILNDFQSTKEAFAQDVFIGRPPDTPFILNKETEETGAFFGLGWKEQRRFCLHMLRDLGLGKSKMEGHMQEEIDELLENFEKNVNKPFCVRDILAPSMSNNVAALVFGKRFNYDHPTRKMLTRLVFESSKAAGAVVWLFFFPWIRKIFQFLHLQGTSKIEELTVELKTYIRKEIEEHEATLDPDNPRDFIDSYLIEMHKRTDDPTYAKPVLEDIVGALFGGGSETVRQSVEWLLLLVASNQDQQQRIQAEIKEAVGYNRPPTWLDRQNMPYTDAYIMEMMRWRTIIPLNLLRYTLADTELNGYFIPKHSSILSNHWAIHHDPTYWGPDAEEFKPERFLNEAGTQTKKWDRYVPFSIGKRACPGEPMAKVEIFLYLISILQKYDVKLPEGKVADLDGELGIGLQIKSQEIVLTKRAS